MRKLFLIFNVMLIFLITTIGRVKAYEEPVGYFFGKEYPIIYNDSNIMPMYDVSGYNVTAYYRNDSNSGWVSFNQAVTLPNTNTRDFMYQIVIPEPIEQNVSFSMYFRTTFVGGISGKATATLYSSGYTSSSSESMTISKTATNNFSFSSNGDFSNPSGNVYVLEIRFKGSPSSVNFAMVLGGLNISRVSTDGLVASIASVLAELVPYIMNIDKNIASILTWMSPILDAINSGTSSIVSAINSMSGSVVSAINSMSNAIQSDLNTINSSINSMNTNLGTKIDSMKTTLNTAIVTMMNTLNNSLNDLLGENQDTTNATNVNDSTTSNFENVSGQYDDIERSVLEDFENNLANVDTDTDLLNVADFKSTSNFIATNLTNIYNSHDYIGNMIIFTLVIGFSLTLIGIKVRR